MPPAMLPLLSTVTMPELPFPCKTVEVAEMPSLVTPAVMLPVYITVTAPAFPFPTSTSEKAANSRIPADNVAGHADRHGSRCVVGPRRSGENSVATRENVAGVTHGEGIADGIEQVHACLNCTDAETAGVADDIDRDLTRAEGPTNSIAIESEPMSWVRLLTIRVVVVAGLKSSPASMPPD